jgi:two-component system heavy metal sensor histidine kinase CusS
MRSFRLRLAVFSAILAGIALASFGGGAFWLIRNAKIERVDGALRLHAEREVNRFSRQGVRPAPEAEIMANLGVVESADVAMLMIDANGEQAYRSTHWPTAIDPDTLRWPGADERRESTARFTLITSALAEPPNGGPQGPPGHRQRQHPPPPYAERFPHEPPPRQPPPESRTPPDYDAPPAAGTPLDSAPPAAPAPLRESPTQAVSPPPPPARSVLFEQSVGGQVWHIALARGGRSKVAIAINLHTIDTEMHGVRNAFLVTLPLALLLIGIGAWLVSASALRPIHKLTRLARDLTAEGLDKRIAAEQEDHEFVDLIAVFNRMLGRLERSFKQSHRFSADAAHELKTPLAIIQGQLERAIQNTPTGSVVQTQLAGVLDEVQRLATISRKLLLLSQADSGALRLHREPFALSAALEALTEDARMLAPDLQINAHIEPGLELIADGPLLTQVFHNLLSNAIKYNTAGGWITLTALRSGPQTEIRFANSSLGIANADRERIFERFFRADSAHNRHIEGVGLGLALSREIVRAHGGSLQFHADDDGRVTLTLSLRHA